MAPQGQLPLFDSVYSASTLDSSKSPYQSMLGSYEAFGKYIVYVDESGDHSLVSIDKNYPIFVLAFCVFHKQHYSEAIVPAVEKFKFNHFGHDQVVLHENEIRKETGAFNIFKSREQRLTFLEQLTRLIHKSNFILISSVIDKRNLAKSASTELNPYHVALASCMESLYEFLAEKSEQAAKTHIVVESRGRKEDSELELEFRRVCDGNNKFGKSFPFEIIFSDKKAMSTGLQLADLVARPIGLNVLKPTQENRAFDVLKEKFYCSGGRDAVGDGYVGIGLKILSP